jgi:hypothetical protein
MSHAALRSAGALMAGFAKAPDVARRLGDAAVATAGERLAARIAEAAPEIAVNSSDGVVVLQAPRLVPRIFGSRRRGADPRLAGILPGIQGGMS